MFTSNSKYLFSKNEIWIIKYNVYDRQKYTCRICIKQDDMTHSPIPVLFPLVAELSFASSSLLNAELSSVVLPIVEASEIVDKTVDLFLLM